MTTPADHHHVAAGCRYDDTSTINLNGRTLTAADCEDPDCPTRDVSRARDTAPSATTGDEAAISERPKGRCHVRGVYAPDAYLGTADTDEARRWYHQLHPGWNGTTAGVTVVEDSDGNPVTPAA